MSGELGEGMAEGMQGKTWRTIRQRTAVFRTMRNARKKATAAYRAQQAARGLLRRLAAEGMR